MASTAQNLSTLQARMQGYPARLVAVTKTRTVAELEQLYAAGQRLFGENRVQELLEKQPLLPPDVQWHLIGHLQTNKVKYIAGFVSLIHSVDSLRLLEEINRQAARHGRVIPCLLQLHIAAEETKFGLSYAEADALLTDPLLASLQNTEIIGLMGMATFTDDPTQISREFAGLKAYFDGWAARPAPSPNVHFRELSMGMSGDYPLALTAGSTLVRVGSALFDS